MIASYAGGMRYLLARYFSRRSLYLSPRGMALLFAAVAVPGGLIVAMVCWLKQREHETMPGFERVKDEEKS